MDDGDLVDAAVGVVVEEPTPYLHFLREQSSP
jgi:hypothetical protein